MTPQWVIGQPHDIPSGRPMSTSPTGISSLTRQQRVVREDDLARTRILGEVLEHGVELAAQGVEPLIRSPTGTCRRARLS